MDQLQQAVPATGKEPTLRDRRNTQIRDEFKKLHKEGFRNEVIYERLSARYFLVPGTIEQIVFERGGYVRPALRGTA